MEAGRSDFPRPIAYAVTVTNGGRNRLIGAFDSNRSRLAVINGGQSVRPLVIAPFAGELMPGQGQLDQPLAIGALGRRGAPHRRLGLQLRVVLGTHEPTLAGRSGQARDNFLRRIADDDTRGCRRFLHA